LSSRPPTIRELFVSRRDNPMLWWMTGGRGFRISHVFLILMLMGAMAASLAVAVNLFREGERAIVGLAGLAVYSLFVPFLLALAIPLSCRRVTRQQKEEIWTTPLQAREIAFGVLYPPLRSALVVIALYPVAFGLFLVVSFWTSTTSSEEEISKTVTAVTSAILPVLLFSMFYLYFTVAAAHVPLMSRLRTFPIAWSPVLIAPIWAFGHIMGMTGMLVVGTFGYEEMLKHIMGPGQERHDVGTVISLCLLVVVVIVSVIVMGRALIARAGIKWLAEAVPHVGAQVDWFSADCTYGEWSASEKRQAWSDFLKGARSWWLWRLKWATVGWAMSVAPLTLGVLLVPWGEEFRSLEWTGLMATPLIVPTMIFLPSIIWPDHAPVPFMPRRLLVSSLILFAPCAFFCVASVVLGLMLEDGFTLFDWAMIPYVVFMMLLMTSWLVLPCYVAWLCLACGRGRKVLAAIFGGIYLAFARAAAGIWTWETLPGIVLLGLVVALMASTALLGGVSLLLQGCFVDQAKCQENKGIAPASLSLSPTRA